MTTFILLAVLVGSPAKFVGEYGSESACRDAIRQIMVAKLAPGSEKNARVMVAVDTAMMFQQEYVCVKR